MQTIPEQISSAGRAQLQAQLELFSSIAMATVENTGRLALFQLDASREALNRSYTAWSQWMTSGPRSMLELMSNPQMAGGSSAGHAVQEDPQQAPVAKEAHEEATGQPAPEGSLVAEPHPAQPPLARTPIAEAAAEVVPEGQASVSLAAAPTQEDGPVTLPKVKPLEAAPPSAQDDARSHRKGLPRK